MRYAVIYLGATSLKMPECCSVTSVAEPTELINEMNNADLVIINANLPLSKDHIELLNTTVEQDKIPLLLYIDVECNDVICHGCNYIGIIRAEDSSEIVESLITNIIKNQQKTAELLSDSDLLNLFLKYNKSYVFFKDENARVLKLSDNYEFMLGIPAQDAIGKNMMEIFPPELAKSMVEDDLRIIKDRVAVEVVEELNGRFYKTSKFPIHRDGKSPLLAGFTIDISDMKEAEKLLMESKSKVERLTVTDEMLNIYNRRGFLQALETEINTIRHSGLESALIILDVDNFKTLNDTLGHFKADDFLRDLVNKVNGIMRISDTFGRLGGDEFALICVSSPIAMGIKVAKRIQEAVNQYPVIIDGEAYTYSVSIGLTEINSEHLNIEHLLNRADLALYEAKRGGRNCVKMLE